MSRNGKGVPKKGRKEARNEEAADKDSEQQAGTGGCVPEDYRRGVSLGAKTQVAQLAQSEHSALARNLRELLASASQDVRDVLDELKLCGEQHRDVSLNNEEEQKAFREWRDGLVKDLKALCLKKRECKQELKNAHGQSTTPIR